MIMPTAGNVPTTKTTTAIPHINFCQLLTVEMSQNDSGFRCTSAGTGCWYKREAFSQVNL
jgi:hypothetical protein